MQYNKEELTAIGVPTSAIPQDSEVSSTPLSPGEYPKQAYDQQKQYIANDFVLREEMIAWEEKLNKNIEDFLDRLPHKHQVTDQALQLNVETDENRVEDFDLNPILDDSIVKKFKKKAQNDSEKVTAPLQGEASVSLKGI